jgi:hypothetical protein
MLTKESDSLDCKIGMKERNFNDLEYGKIANAL